MDQRCICCIIILRNYVPTEIALFIASMIYCHNKIFCGSRFTCFLIDGVLHKIHEGLGYEETDFPQKVIFPGEKINLVSLGYDHSIVVTDLNQIYAWGYNRNGQLGLGCNATMMQPMKLILNSKSKIKSVECGHSHTGMVTEFGECYVWGYNGCGELGLGDNINRYLPQKLSIENIKSISCSLWFTMIVTKEGECFSCGQNTQGQLGIGNNINQNSLQKLELTGVIFTTCGDYHVFALTTDGVYSWGHNLDGQLGTPKPHANVWFSEVLFHISYGKFLSQRLKNARKNIENACIFICFCRAVWAITQKKIYHKKLI